MSLKRTCITHNGPGAGRREGFYPYNHSKLSGAKALYLFLTFLFKPIENHELQKKQTLCS